MLFIEYLKKISIIRPDCNFGFLVLNLFKFDFKKIKKTVLQLMKFFLISKFSEI